MMRRFTSGRQGCQPLAPVVTRRRARESCRPDERGDPMYRDDLRTELVETALNWEDRFGVIPSITSAISEYDAAMLVGLSERQYATAMEGRTAVSKGFDFTFDARILSKSRPQLAICFWVRSLSVKGRRPAIG